MKYDIFIVIIERRFKNSLDISRVDKILKVLTYTDHFINTRTGIKLSNKTAILAGFDMF